MPDEAAIAEPPPAEAAESRPSFFSVLESELPTDGAPATPTPAAPAAPAKAEPEPVKSDGRAPAETLQKSAETKAEAPASEIDKIADAIKGKNDQERANIGILRTRGREFEDKARALEAKIAEAESKGKNTDAMEARLKEIETKNAELTETLTRANVEALPEFRDKYVTGRRKLVEQVQSIVSDNGGDPKAVEVALSLKGRARIDALREVADDLPGYQQGMLGQVIRELDVLDTEAGEKRAKSNEYWKEVQAKQQREAEESDKALIRNVHETFERSRQSLSAELEVLKPIKGEGMEWWNEQAEGIVKRAGEAFKEKWDVRTASEAALWKEAGPVYRELFQKEREYNDAEIPKRDAKIAELTAELEGIYKKSPTITGAGAGANAQAKKGFFEVLAEQMPGEA